MRAALKITPQSKLEKSPGAAGHGGKVSIPYLYDPNTETGLF